MFLFTILISVKDKQLNLQSFWNIDSDHQFAKNQTVNRIKPKQKGSTVKNNKLPTFTETDVERATPQRIVSDKSLRKHEEKNNATKKPVLRFLLYEGEDEYVVKVGTDYNAEFDIDSNDLDKYDQVSVIADQKLNITEYLNPRDLALLVNKCSKGNIEILAFNGFDFTGDTKLFTALIQNAVNSRLLKLVFYNCAIPKIDEHFKLSMRHNETEKLRPLYCLSLINCSFESGSKVGDILAICEQLRWREDRKFDFDDGLSMIDISQNDFTPKEVDLICDELNHLEFIFKCL